MRFALWATVALVTAIFALYFWLTGTEKSPQILMPFVFVSPVWLVGHVGIFVGGWMMRQGRDQAGAFWVRASSLPVMLIMLLVFVPFCLIIALFGDHLDGFGLIFFPTYLAVQAAYIVGLGVVVSMGFQRRDAPR